VKAPPRREPCGPAGAFLAVTLAVVLAALPAPAQTPPLARVAPVGVPSAPAAPSPAPAGSSPVPPPAPAPSPTPAAAPPEPPPPPDDNLIRGVVGVTAIVVSTGFAWGSILLDLKAQHEEVAARTLLVRVDPAGDTTGSACTAGTVSAGTCAQIKAAFQSRDVAIGLRNTCINLTFAALAVAPLMVYLPAIRRRRLADPQVGIGPGGVALRGSF
jgi:hypothetical protein